MKTCVSTSASVVFLAGLALVAGCVSMIKMLPPDYINLDRQLAVRVINVAPSPTLDTSQAKNVVASTTFLIRDRAMRNRMAGITTERLGAAVEEALRAQLADTFTISTNATDLALDVVISRWGWSVPTGEYGESVDIHNFHISGTARIVDVGQNRATVYFTYNGTDTPLGDHLTAEKCEAALPAAAADFAAQIKRFILKPRTQTAP